MLLHHNSPMPKPCYFNLIFKITSKINRSLWAKFSFYIYAFRYSFIILLVSLCLYEIRLNTASYYVFYDKKLKKNSHRNSLRPRSGQTPTQNLHGKIFEFMHQFF